jgi:universal stress protein A
VSSNGYRTIVVAYDFSENARAALYVALDLANHLAGDLHLVHVLQPPVYPYPVLQGGAPPPLDLVDLRRQARDSLAQVAAEIESAPGKVEPHVVEGHNIAATLRQTAEELGADLIVMGTHGRTGIAHVFLGSAAERTLRHAPCPVLVVPHGEPEEKD